MTTSTDAGHTHRPAPPRLTEPLLRTHVRDEHGWTVRESVAGGYFTTLVAHRRAHRKSRLTVAS